LLSVGGNMDNLGMIKKMNKLISDSNYFDRMLKKDEILIWEAMKFVSKWEATANSKKENIKDTIEENARILASEYWELEKTMALIKADTEAREKNRGKQKVIVPK